jgi:hypothetical protein|tara:strand:+ start:2135 stop:2848 length:714 start_codon:yes stop_codon:yes gene_type:complete
MTKTIFVVGCSYSHHDRYVEPKQTWPCLLQDDLKCKIINCSVPGNSNLSYFYRLKELEYQFGKPDKVIVQLTGPDRVFLHRKNVPICNITKRKGKDYYYDIYDNAYSEAGISITPSNITKRLFNERIQEYYNITRKDLVTFFRSFTSYDNANWLNLKEILLIDSYFKDVVFFSWNLNYNYIALDEPWANENDINYIGSIKNMISAEEFNNYSHIPEKDDHFNVAGHYAVKELIKPYV